MTFLVTLSFLMTFLSWAALADNILKWSFHLHHKCADGVQSALNLQKWQKTTESEDHMSQLHEADWGTSGTR